MNSNSFQSHITNTVKVPATLKNPHLGERYDEPQKKTSDAVYNTAKTNHLQSTLHP